MNTFDRVNKRRHELINKKFSDVGLNPREQKVFDRIQNHTMEAIEENMEGMNIDFRLLILAEYKLKQWRKQLYPKGEKYLCLQHKL